VSRPGDNGEATAGMKLDGGGARAQKGGEESGDWCGGGRARVSTFYKGWREAEAAGEGGATMVNDALHCHCYQERRGWVWLT
jgi:hypothetical protein